MIEDAFAQVMQKSILPYLPADFLNDTISFTESFFIAKLHGDVSRWDSIVIGDADFRRAQWVKKTIDIVRGNALLVFGVSGKDRLVNEFLFDLPGTVVFMFMSPETALNYAQAVSSFRESVPKHIHIVPIPHADLPDLIASINPNAHTRHVIDCPWGEMPPTLNDDVWAEEDADAIRSFLGGNLRSAIVCGNAGSGLSSILARLLEDRARSPETTVVRVEAKEWMCWEKYVLYLQAVLPDVFKSYAEIRHRATSAWNPGMDAKAMGEAFNCFAGPAVICIEHCERLPEHAWPYIKCMLESTNADLKCLFASTEFSTGEFDFDTEIHIQPPNMSRLLALCGDYSFRREDMEFVVSYNERCDFNTAVLAASARSKTLLTDDELGTHIQNCAHEALCKAIVDEISIDEKLLRLTKAAVLLRSPRSAHQLRQIALEVDSDAAAREKLEALCGFGILTTKSRTGTNPTYAMSTTIRRNLLKVISWDDNEQENLSSRIADYFSTNAIKQVHSQGQTRVAWYRVIPILSMALYHYKLAKNAEQYIRLVERVYEDLVQMYLFSVVQIWLDDAGTLAKNSGEFANTYNVIEGLIRARLARVESVPRELKLNIAKVKSGLTSSNNVVHHSSYHLKLQWLEGIASVLDRQYGTALKTFQGILASLDRNTQPAEWLRANLRIAQTLISLGRIRESEDLLTSIETFIDSLGRSEQVYQYHSRALIARHRSTISTLKMLLQVPNGKSVEDLYIHAISESKRCRDLSVKIMELKERKGRPDETGIGIAQLKRAQAMVASGKVDEAPRIALKAASILSAFPNNQWWRICCHDTAARAYALAGNLDDASQNLGIARAVAETSFRDDLVRYSQLQCTEGMIAFHGGRISDAIGCFENSVSNQSDNAPVSAHHLDWLIRAYAMTSKHDEMKAALESRGDINIE
ncbi:MAG: hypothetical protein KDB11_33145 [Planctomycetales bacterium]|nr:hypothetical protein [Planctomycetales bacterium]